jgi:peptidoglycan/xylan/chitin deacetylase (PgdA/CDA1 family)
MGWLARNGYRVVSVREFISLATHSKRGCKKIVGLTFDDGYENNLSIAIPILHEFGFTATIFVTTEHCGGYNIWCSRDIPRMKLMNWNQLIDLSQQGMEIGAHTVSHPDLTKLSISESKSEIVTCKQQIEAHLCQPIVSFAYPYGIYNKAVLSLVEEAGFQFACTLIPGTFNLNRKHPLLLKRIPVPQGASIMEFSGYLTATTDLYSLFHRWRRRSVRLQLPM